MARVEAAITQSKATEEEATKTRVGVISAFSCTRLPPKNVQPEEAKAVKELAKDGDIVILPTDKRKDNGGDGPQRLQRQDVGDARIWGHLPAHG